MGHNEGIKHLQNIPLFASVNPEELEHINSRLKEVVCQAGEIIISEGEVGDCLYIIRKGRVKVLVDAGDNEEPIVLSYLTDGDYFGEMALITGDPRSATVLSETETRLWQLDKNDFDIIIMNNPSITLSLTHMLSHRLKLANKARESSERYYKHQISPRGQLKDVDVIKLLKFAEENSLTGKIILEHGSQKASFEYQKGQLQHLEFENKEEDEAMDEILSWENGEFIIEPTVFKITEQVSNEPPPEKIFESHLKSGLLEKYLSEKLNEMVEFAGSRTVQSALNKSKHKFGGFFEVSEDFTIQIMPDLLVKIRPSDPIGEKHLLFIAILLRDLVNSLSRDILGLEFWNIKSADEQVDEHLSENQFYEYYEQAVDFV